MPIRARSEDKKVKIVKGKRTRDADFYKKGFEMTIGELFDYIWDGDCNADGEQYGVDTMIRESIYYYPIKILGIEKSLVPETKVSQGLINYLLIRWRGDYQFQELKWLLSNCGFKATRKTTVGTVQTGVKSFENLVKILSVYGVGLIIEENKYKIDLFDYFKPDRILEEVYRVSIKEYLQNMEIQEHFDKLISDGTNLAKVDKEQKNFVVYELNIIPNCTW